MLIPNNGVPKSGSTWIQKILCQLLDPAFPSENWRNSWFNPSVDPERLSTRLRTHNQNNTIAARAQADMKMSARRSKRMAILRQSFNRPNMFSIL